MPGTNRKKTSKKDFLYNDVKKRILADYADVNDFTPMKSEREFSCVYHVSRPTIRKALQKLEEEGYVRLFSGRGATYLGNPSAKRWNQFAIGNQNISLYNLVATSGCITRSKVLTQKVEPCRENVAEHLEIPKETPVFHLERVRYINNDIYCLSNSYIPYELCPELVHEEFSEVSLHQTMEHYGVVPEEAVRIVEYKHAGIYDAPHLALQPGDPIALIRSTIKDAAGRLVEYVEEKIPVEKAIICMTVYRNKNQHNQFIERKE